VSQTVPLQLWYSAEHLDHLTVASDEGRKFAMQRGYTLINGTLGFVYPVSSSTTAARSLQAPPQQRHNSQSITPVYRQAYSQALLESVWVQ